MPNALKTIATFGTEIEAELFKGKLESSGIKAFIFKDDCGGMRPHMQLTDGVKLKVAAIDLEIAKEILNTDSDDEQQIDTDEPDSIKRIRQLLHRSRGWILVGFAVIPGWISFPISFIYSTKAFKTYKDADIKDSALKNQILRIQFVSAFFTILFWGASIYYICT